jgi:hypothetical protein
MEMTIALAARRRLTEWDRRFDRSGQRRIVLSGQSRSKNGVASLAYAAGHPRLHCI